MMKKSPLLYGLLTFLLLFSPLQYAQEVSHDETLIAGKFGNVPEPQKINAIFSAGNPADVFLLALAPERILGFSYFDMSSEKGALFPEPVKKLPKLGRLSGRSSTISLEALLSLNPDIIIDIGSVDGTYLSNARRFSEQSGVPYVLMRGKLSDTPRQLREMGHLLGVEERAEKLAVHAEKMLARAKKYNEEHPVKLRAYYGRGADGLETGFAGSMHTEAMEYLGLINVAQARGFSGIAKVSMEQILGWDPEIIITQDENFYRLIQEQPLWKNVSAVKNRRIYLIPDSPFGWLDVPPSLNRLPGLRWLEAQLTPEAKEGLNQEMIDFFSLFYHIELKEYQLNRIMER